MNQSPALTDNLLPRAKRMYVDKRSFEKDGKSVDYQRLVVEFTINNVPYLFEAPVDRKDLQLLSVTDKAEGSLED